MKSCLHQPAWPQPFEKEEIHFEAKISEGKTEGNHINESHSSGLLSSTTLGTGTSLVSEFLEVALL